MNSLTESVFITKNWEAPRFDLALIDSHFAKLKEQQKK